MSSVLVSHHDYVFCTSNYLLLLMTYLMLYQTLGCTGIRGLMRGIATLPHGNQELLVVRDKVCKTTVVLGVSKSLECDIFSLQCFDTVGWATGRASSL